MGIINAFPGGEPTKGYKRKVEITTSQTWTVPAGVTEIAVRLFGGGGSGAVGSYGAGGGGGHMAYAKLSVTPGTSYAIVIGAGGKAMSRKTEDSNGDYGQRGEDGGISRFGSILTAYGGGCGEGSDRYEGDGGSGGTGGGSFGWGSGYANSSDDDFTMGGAGTYGGGGGSGSVNVDAIAFGGVYGGNGGNYSALSQCGVESRGGKNQSDNSDTKEGCSGGGGGYRANGGDGWAYYTNSSLPYRRVAGGGGGGWEGGDGGSVVLGRHHGGGGGGYGPTKIAGDGISNDNTVDAYGGKGYGAGGGGGYYKSGNGAPGICIIEYFTY